jgi:hypothetical protein
VTGDVDVTGGELVLVLLRLWGVFFLPAAVLDLPGLGVFAARVLAGSRSGPAATVTATDT